MPLPADPVPDPVIPSITHSFSRKSDNRIELESRDPDRVFRAIVEYAVGSGRHGITMLAKDEEGIDRELRISYFGQDQSWGQTKGIDFAPRDAGDHIGMGLGRKALNHCLSCHTTWFRSVGPARSALEGPKARTTASAASDVTDQGLTTARQWSPASRNSPSGSPRRPHRKSV